MERVAVVDLGSNSCRLSIFEISEDKTFRVIKDLRELVRLSEGMGEERILKEKAIARTEKALLYYRAVAEEMGAARILVIATAAVRYAQNGSAFQKRMEDKTGLSLTVIDGDTEAYYDYLAVINTLPVTDCVITDTGGGSTEFILVRDKKKAAATSLPLGAVLLLEEFGEREDEMLREVQKRIVEGVPFLKEAEGLPVCAMGGSARALTVMHTGVWDSPIHGKTLSKEDVFRRVSEIKNTPMQKRMEIPFIDKQRADIMVSGLAPVYGWMKETNSPALICCQSSLREGAVFAEQKEE